MDRAKEQRLEEFINNNSFIEVIENSEDAFILQCGVTRLTITKHTVDGVVLLTYDLQDITPS